MNDIQRHTRLCGWTFLGGVGGTIATLAFLLWGPALGEDGLDFAGLILLSSCCLAVLALLAWIGPMLDRYVHRKLSEYRTNR